MTPTDPNAAKPTPRDVLQQAVDYLTRIGAHTEAGRLSAWANAHYPLESETSWTIPDMGLRVFRHMTMGTEPGSLVPIVGLQNLSYPDRAVFLRIEDVAKIAAWITELPPEVAHGG